MKYLYSQIDKENLDWFSNDMTVASLTEISLMKGDIRGLNTFVVNFIPACAFHNDSSGFKLPERRSSYYSFSDFFVQASQEIPPQGIVIRYRIMHNRWRKSNNAPDGIGNLYQVRRKTKGGKWNKYSYRVKRNVIYSGVQRVVPPSEKMFQKAIRLTFLTKLLRDGKIVLKIS